MTSMNGKPCNVLYNRKQDMFDDWYMGDNLHERGLENVREIRDPEYDT